MSLWNWIKNNTTTIIATTVAAVVTGGASLVIQAAAIGGAYLVGSALDADRKQKEQEDKKLNLAGKAGEAITGQVNNLQNQRNQIVQESEDLIKELQKHKAKLNDPNTSETEKAQIRSEIATLVSSKGSLEQKIKGLDDKINDLLKNAQQTITGKGGLANLEMDYQTKLIIAVVVFAIIYFMVIKDNDRR